MANGEQCLACSEPVKHQRVGLVAPFLAHRIWGRKPFRVMLLECANCGFAFFNCRLKAHEEDRLYKGYRENDYQQSRFRFEPWYTQKLNRRIGSDPAVVTERRCQLRAILTRLVDVQRIQSVLDFGGDKGQLIDGLLPARNHVYDVSGVRCLDGIASFHTIQQCLSNEYDLIVCSNVLEHVSSPRAVVAQIRELSKNGTIVFLEVPSESPFSVASKIKRVIQLAILGVLRPHTAVSLMRPGFLYVMHEHLNFFTGESLRQLVKANGFELIESGTYELTAAGAFKTTTWCLARVR